MHSLTKTSNDFSTGIHSTVGQVAGKTLRPLPFRSPGYSPRSEPNQGIGEHASLVQGGPQTEFAASPSEGRTIKVSETWAERAAAFRLVHREYCRTGLTADNRMHMRVMKHHLLDTTQVMVSENHGEIDFTVTLVRDGIHGMPADSLFANEIDAMRAQGLNLAEVSCVASDRGDDKQGRRECFDRLVQMISLTIHTARRRGVDRLLLAVHPRHAKVYCRLFGCFAWTAAKEYEAVQGNPAILCSHDFAELDQSRYPLYDRIYGVNYAPWQLDGSLMSAKERLCFAQAVELQGSEFVPMAA